MSPVYTKHKSQTDARFGMETGSVEINVLSFSYVVFVVVLVRMHTADMQCSC